MKSLFCALITSLLVLMFGKKENKAIINSITLNDTTTIKMHEILFCNTENLSISFDSVLNDSRCPASVKCIWEGNAEAQFTFTYNEKKTTYKLNTNYKNQNDTSINGSIIKLLNLNPYPQTFSIIDQREYNARIVIRKK